MSKKAEQPDLQRKLGELPESPGVYIFRDARSEVIYVGKAVNLRSRVRSYFTKSSDTRAFYELLTRDIADVSTVVTDSEKEALILENTLIKQFKPRYNVNLTDDASYICLKIDLREDYPRVQLPSGRERAVASQVQRDTPGEKEVLWFGPYSSSRKARETMRVLNVIFPLRKCSVTQFNTRHRPCIHHQMGRCMGPCSGHVDPAEYRDMLDEVILVLNGKYEKVEELLAGKMQREAGLKHYERAAKLRDRIHAIQATFETQRVAAVEAVDRDIFGLHRDAKAVLIQVMFVRDGKLGEFDSFKFELRHRTPEKVFDAFLTQFYGQQRFIPQEVLIPAEIEDAELLAAYLSDVKSRKVSVICPQRGEKLRLVELAARNAEISFTAKVSASKRTEELLQSLQEKLGLANLPRRVECFDISNIRGHLAVGSMVSFADGKPDKSNYRRFKIRTVTQSDDFAMMREVLGRRFAKAKEDEVWPDLAVIDGGKGQLSAAVAILKELNIADVDVIGLAKGKLKGKAEKKLRTDERVFLPGEDKPVTLPQDAPELLYLMRIRDEAHRFAIQYHKLLRSKRLAHKPLDGIPGIGDVKKSRLMDHFGSYAKIRAASVEQLQQVQGISASDAEAIHHHLGARQPDEPNS